MANITVDNSKDAVLNNRKKWSNPGATFYDQLMKCDNWRELLKEAYLLAPVSEIKNTPHDGTTPFSRSGCKYPHHSIRDGKLVVNLGGLMAANRRARQQGIFYGNVMSHIMKHFEELEIVVKTAESGELLFGEEAEAYQVIQENFNDINLYLMRQTGVNLFDPDTEFLSEASHGKLKVDHRLATDAKTGHRLHVIYSLDGIELVANNIIDTAGGPIRAFGDKRGSTGPDEVAKLKRYGNTDHMSKNQEVLAIVDLDTGEKLQSAFTKSPFGYSDSLVEIRVGEIDQVASYKSTFWHPDQTMNDIEGISMRELLGRIRGTKGRSMSYVMQDEDGKSIKDRAMGIQNEAKQKMMIYNQHQQIGAQLIQELQAPGTSPERHQEILDELQARSDAARRLQKEINYLSKRYKRLGNVYKMYKTTEMNESYFEEGLGLFESFITERSHGKLQVDHRLAIDHNTGHDIHIVYSLDGMKLTQNNVAGDGVGRRIENGGKIDDKEVALLRRYGNTDHESYNQRVLAIIDMKTGEKLDEVWCKGPFTHRHGLVKIKVGEIDTEPSYKSTVWHPKNELNTRARIARMEGHRVRGVAARRARELGYVPDMQELGAKYHDSRQAYEKDDLAVTTGMQTLENVKREREKLVKILGIMKRHHPGASTDKRNIDRRDLSGINRIIGYTNPNVDYDLKNTNYPRFTEHEFKSAAGVQYAIDYLDETWIKNLESILQSRIKFLKSDRDWYVRISNQRHQVKSWKPGDVRFESSGMTLEGFDGQFDEKTPIALWEWMHEMIDYDKEPNWHLKSADELLDTLKGNCHDQSFFVSYILHSWGIPNWQLFFVEFREDSEEGGNSHTLTYYKDENGYWWFENAWEDQAGLHGPYQDKEAVKQAIMDAYNEDDDINSHQFDGIVFSDHPNYKLGMNLYDYVNSWDPDDDRLFDKDTEMTEAVAISSKTAADVKTIVDTLPDKEKKYIGNAEWSNTEKTIYRDIIYDGDTPVAFLEIYKFPEEKDTGYICVAIADGKRGRGYAKRLVNKVITHYDGSCKLNYLGWLVDSDNTASISLAKSFGFKQDRKDGSEIIFKLPLVTKTKAIKEAMEWIENFVHDDVFREAADVNSLYELKRYCTTPNELLKWMSGIRYGWFSHDDNQIHGMDDPEYFDQNYKLQTPNETVKRKVGVCWDCVEVEREWFKHNGYNYWVFYIEINDGKNCPSHTFLVYEDNGQYCWFEALGEAERGIKKYDDFEDLIDDVMYWHRMQNMSSNTSPMFVTYLEDPPIYHCSCEEYMDYAHGMRKVDPDDFMDESTEYFEERSHGKLKQDFREVYDYETGHTLRLVYSLENIEVVDGMNKYLQRFPELDKSEVLDDVQKHITRDGNFDHKSKGQKLLAILDMDEWKKRLQTATVIGVYPGMACIYAVCKNKGKKMSEGCSIEEVREEYERRLKEGRVAPPRTVTVGEVEQEASYKTTSWRTLGSPIYEPVGKGRGMMVKNILGVNRDTNEVMIHKPKPFDRKKRKFTSLLESTETLPKEDHETASTIVKKLKTPEDLYEWMKTIQYGWLDQDGELNGTGDDDDENYMFDQYRLQAPGRLVRTRVGVCWDCVEFERLWFEKHTYPYAVIYVEVQGEDGARPTHSFIIYKNRGEDDRVYWFESSWKEHAGIHEYKDLETCLNDAVDKVVESFGVGDGGKVIVRRLDRPMKTGTTCEEYYRQANDSTEVDMGDLFYDEIFNEKTEQVIPDSGGYTLETLPDIMYFGSRHKHPTIQNKRVFLTPYKGIASLFIIDSMEAIADEFRKQNGGKDPTRISCNTGYEEWNKLEGYDLIKPLKMAHIRHNIKSLDKVLTGKSTGYIHAVDVSGIKDQLKLFTSKDADREVYYDGGKPLKAVEIIEHTIKWELKYDPIEEKHHGQGILESVLESGILGDNTWWLESYLHERGVADFFKTVGSKATKRPRYTKEYRLVIGENDGHLYKVTFELNPENVTADNMDTGAGRDKLAKSIVYTGHGNYQSKGNRVLDIVDMCNRKHVPMVSAYPPIHNSGGTLQPMTLESHMSLLGAFIEDEAKLKEIEEKLKRECPTGITPNPGWKHSVEGSRANGQQPIVYRVGTIDETETYKTTYVNNVLTGMLGLVLESVLLEAEGDPVPEGEAPPDLGEFEGEPADAPAAEAPPAEVPAEPAPVEAPVEQPAEPQPEPAAVDAPVEPAVTDAPVEPAPVDTGDTSVEPAAPVEDTPPAEDTKPKGGKKKESAPKKADKAERKHNGARRKALYKAFIDYCKEINPKNSFGNVYDEDAFTVSYPFVPPAMMYFYRIANPMLCVLEDNITFFPLSDLNKINSENQQRDKYFIFAANEQEMRVLNVDDRKVYRAIDNNGEVVTSDVLGTSFDKYLQDMIHKGDFLSHKSDK